MMPQWTTAISALGEQLGIPNIAVTDNGNFVITMNNNRCIAGEKRKDRYLVYAYEPVFFDASKKLIWAWKKAYQKQHINRPLKAAIYEKNQQNFFIVAIELRENECSPQHLYTAIKSVSQSLDDAEKT